MVSPTPVTTNARLLIIDDDEPCAKGLARILEKAGYTACTAITSPSIAAQRFFQIKPDLVLLDLHMEPLSGIDVLRQMNETIDPRLRPPVIVLTADTTVEAKHEALAAGASEFLAKPADPVEVILRIENLLSRRDLYRRCQIYSEGLERLVDRRTAQLQRRTADLEKAISELRRTQQQVIQQERMRALGTMASGIAHDLNNGLTIILGYGDILLRNTKNFPPKSRARADLEKIVLAGHDNAELVKRLREFYRPSDTREHRQAIELNKLVEESLALTMPRWKSQANAAGATIRIKKELNEVPIIAGVPAELREVLTNLIFNAVDAMPQGGRLCFRTKETRGQVQIQIADTGIGMSEETQRKCLEPFFTTKGERGSGLGLAVSYGIIRRHGGSISIKSRLNEGATFTIILPVPTEAPEQLTIRSKTKVRPLRILVVDDHPAICEIVSAYLAEDRHVVATASNAKEAMERFCTERFDLVITDRAMPEVNGDELAGMIKVLQPREPVIMLTGFADLMVEGNHSTENVDLVLSKPARLDDLREAITAVMARDPCPPKKCDPVLLSTESSK
jgi:signal transduction histidine kinase